MQQVHSCRHASRFSISTSLQPAFERGASPGPSYTIVMFCVSLITLSNASLQRSFCTYTRSFMKLSILLSERHRLDDSSPLDRCSARISSGPFQPDQIFTDDPKATKNRFLLVQAITAQFWKVWVKVYFPSLLLRQKWHTERRNLMENDICILKDSNVFRGEWRLCKVSKVFPDSSGKVRNVRVMVKARQGGSAKYVPTKAIFVDRHVSN